MRIQYKLENRDTSTLIKYFYYFSEEVRREKIKLFYIRTPIIMLTIFSLYSFRVSDHLIVQISYVIYHTFFWSAILAPLVFPLFYHWISKKKINKKTQLYEKLDYSIVDNGILSKQPEKEILYEWKGFLQVVESETYYYLYLTKSEIVIIPKRVLDSETNNHLKQIFQQKIQPYKQIHSKSDFRKFLTVFQVVMIFIYIILPFNIWYDKSSKHFNYEFDQSLEESNETADINLSNVSLSVQNLLDKYPSQKKAFSELPVMYQEKMVVPSHSEIPFNIKEVEVYNHVINGDTDSAYIFYQGHQEALAILIYEHDNITTRGREFVNLNQNITGYYHDRYEEKSIFWKDPNKRSSFVYSVSLIKREYGTAKKEKNTFSKEDLVKIANSVIDNYE
ncbi:YcxB family protein [Salirhabdus sp. Marseille-P4669]|uniref:YcxB family protein n=1 Tax=Salirhabdus sp. Marseille-P4669 TaxID=2042310 RepID=UPI00135C1162|nr:YcxB family protein [Salirhabdus sp. Marseille-P4669]